MQNSWKVILAFVGVFIAGAVFGGVFTMRASGRWLHTPPRATSPGRPVTPLPPGGQFRPQVAGPNAPAQMRSNAITPALMRGFTKRLTLTAEQKEKIRPIVGRAGEDFQRLRQENLTDVARVTERMYADVSAVLSPEQREELQAMRQRVESRLQAERQKRIEASAAEAASRGVGGQGRSKGPLARPPDAPR